MGQLRSLWTALFPPKNDRPGYAMICEKVRALEGQFKAVHVGTQAFAKAAGLKCPRGCGACCAGTSVEATELEMLPLAVSLVEDGEAEIWYNLAEQRAFRGGCVFYKPGRKTGEGSCAQYAYRPLVCRLFGYSGNPDKDGKIRFSACTRLRQEQASCIAQANEGIAAGRLNIPVMTQEVMKLTGIDAGLARDLIPINMAFKRAVERVWLSQGRFACNRST
ncbi:MAG: YkgJ family cysteine cluster protein [Candidatus Omnitrophica bacterium]|nr:YkgJ family cysteine cluster protein [Candidatus Omnitrophota bacterium]